MAQSDQERIADLWAVHRGPIASGVRKRRADAWDDTREWVDPSGYRLADRIWDQRETTRRIIDTRIRTGIARGENALSVARDLEMYLNPENAPVRTSAGRIVRDGRPGVITDFPGRPRREGQTVGYGGAGSYPARRLARTEITRAHGAAVMRSAKAIPYSGIRWMLSPSHPKRDICDRHAEKRGLLSDDPGLYLPDSLPRYPPHPQCLCSLSRVSYRSMDATVARLRGKYRLDRQFADDGTGPDAPPLPPRRAPRVRKKAPNPTPPPIAEALAPGSLSPEAVAAIARIKNGDTAREYFRSIGVNVVEASGSAKHYRTIAEAYARRISRGQPVHPRIAFTTGKRSVASYSRSFDARTGQLTDERMTIETRSVFWKDPEAVGREQVDSGHWVRGDVDGLLSHEVGHWRHTEATEHVLFTTGFRVKETGEQVGSFFNFGSPEKAIAETVSKYAATQPAEFVAEVYGGLEGGLTFGSEVMALYRRYGGMIP